jgi:ADP-ribosylglycohydrolase
MLSKDILLDKMRAGWYGKNIGGTLGGPLEGVMELLDVNFYTQQFDGPMPNDDLDLQLVNLHCLEQYGARITTAELGREWVSHVFFPFDEYGHALTNLRRGVAPPLAGGYNNLFTDCMGSPIRSEIWAMVAAGNPELAAYYALQDANVDHAGGEGVYGEIFFAVMECLAFEGTNKMRLIDRALAYIPENCTVAKAVRDAQRHYRDSLDWKTARQRIIDDYATPNFTYAPPNIAFTIIGLLYGKDFSDAICLVCNCGYDTDCTAATLGALLGIMHGMAIIPQKWIDPIGDEIKVSTAVNGFDAPANLEALTGRTYKMCQLVQAEWETMPGPDVFALDHTWTYSRWLLPQGSFAEAELALTLTYQDDHPAIGQAAKRLTVELENRLNVPYEGRMWLGLPEALGVTESHAIALQPGARKQHVFELTRKAADVSPVYHCSIQVERRAGNSRWTICAVPFALVSMAEWRIGGNDTEVTIESALALIDFSVLPGAGAPGRYTAATILMLEEGCEAELIVSTTMPATLRLDGECLFSSDAPTPFIPAYHRSAREKRRAVSLAAGRHQIEIEVEHTDGGFQPLAFYLVDGSKNGNFAHLWDYTLRPVCDPARDQ